MRIQKLIYLFICGISLVACSKGNSLTVPKITADFVKDYTKNLNGSVFFIGPELDSVNVEIVADCDCCASNLAFMNDTSFVYVERCLGGDVYVKGNYLVFGSLLMLHTGNDIVSSEDNYVSEIESVPIYEVIRQEEAYHVYTISNWKGKQVITYSKDDYSEYGISTRISINRFLEEFRKEKILREFLKE